MTHAAQNAEAELAYQLQVAKVKQSIRSEEIEIDVCLHCIVDPMSYPLLGRRASSSD